MNAKNYSCGFRLFFENGLALPFHSPNIPKSIGRAWRADELRLKGFEDLHKLWFVMLRERNLLSTQYLESRRFKQKWFGWDRLHKVLNRFPYLRLNLEWLE